MTDEVRRPSITGRIGPMGCGKSQLMMLEDVIPALESGRKVVTNLPIDSVLLRMLYPKTSKGELVLFDPEPREREYEWLGKKQRKAFSDLATSFAPDAHNGALVVYDELQLDFRNEETYANPFRKAFVDWISLSRHYGCDFIWSTQDFQLVDVAVRRLTVMAAVYFVSPDPRYRNKLNYRLHPVREGEIVSGETYRAISASRDKCVEQTYSSSSNHASGRTFSSPARMSRERKIALICIIALAALCLYFFRNGFLGVKPKIFEKKNDAKKTSTVLPSFVSKSKSDTSSISIDGSVCVAGNCDVYTEGEWLGTIRESDSIPEPKYRRVVGGSGGRSGPTIGGDR